MSVLTNKMIIFDVACYCKHAFSRRDRCNVVKNLLKEVVKILFISADHSVTVCFAEETSKDEL